MHKESRKLVNENQVIVLEDLNVKGLIKNKKLARSIADVSWSMFKTCISYKADWDHKKVVLVDRFWVCPKCGTLHDRDINAAKNIKEEGIRLLRTPPLVV